MKNRIVFATNNNGKIKEIKNILKTLEYEVLPMKEAGIDIDIVEDGDSFEKNAYIKAKAVWDICGGIVMADDSGLEIDYLNGAPGVYSARYMGENTSYEIKNKKILELLEGVPKDKRGARFISVICCILEDGRVFNTKASMEGKIAYETAGEHGFGYDPIFLPEGESVTAAELSPDKKDAISHRGKALRAMKDELMNNIGSV